MKISTTRDQLLPSLVQVSGVVERRQTLPILANILIKVTPQALQITATDLEIELQTVTSIISNEEGEFTVPARKIIDICKALPAEAEINISIKDERAILTSGKSRFKLGLLPAQDYPSIETTAIENVFTIQEKLLKQLIEKTAFAMAQQDVRYYLNGLLFEVRSNSVRTVATDGHRLATSEQKVDLSGDLDIQVIIPRKAILELNRLLDHTENEIKIELSGNHIRFTLDQTIFTSKLIDGRFPDYQRVIPAETPNRILIERDVLRQALIRASILSNEKYRGIRFKLQQNLLQLQSHNPEQEEAEEEIEIDYQGDEISIGFNGGYFLDVLNVINNEMVSIGLIDANSSSLIHGVGDEQNQYVVMPMRL